MKYKRTKTMTVLLTPEEIAEVDSQCQISGAFFPKAIARKQLRKDLAGLKRINFFLEPTVKIPLLKDLIERIEAEVGE